MSSSYGGTVTRSLIAFGVIGVQLLLNFDVS